MHNGLYHTSLGIAAVAAGLFSTSLADAAKPTAAEALSIAPTQEGIEYERPDKAEIARCTVETESAGGISGLVVRGPGGQLLRRFLDTNGDNRVDQWCYFKDGIEVYRDIDSDFEKDKAKVNECRWLGTAGTRWGIDENQDGTIDRWKEISPEEVTSELVAAIRDKDAARFRRLLLTAEEIDGLGLSEKQAEELRRKVAAAAGSFAKEVGNQKLITAQTEWIHFGGSRPGVIPAGTNGSTKDITVYDNVTAVVETPSAGDKKHAQIVVGSLVRVGDGWRMIDLPRTLSADPKAASLGFFFLAPVANRPEIDAGAVAGDVSEESRKLFDDLNALDRSLAAATSNDELARLNARRADLLEKLIGSADNAEDRSNWVRQYAETIGAAVTTGAFPEGVQRLEKLADSIGKSDGGQDLVPIVKLRLLQAFKDRDSQSEDADYTKVHQEWVKGLEDFVSEFSSRPEAAEAMLQLAMGFEIAAKPKDAVTWYGRIVKDFPQSEVAQKAAGARYRIESVGKRLALKGKSLDGRSTTDVGSYSGRVVLIHYWANWCEPCKEDIEKIRLLQAKHGSVFQPIGISLDMAAAEAAKFASENRLTWPQLFEAGGMDESRLATELGVLTLPTMLLIDKQGRLVSYDLHGDDLDAEVRKLLTTTRPASTK
ncbi:MAG TPA: TlpA disulfide reductase family protein [Pirellulaceae bacterium]|nr:TlpA disulfide reductase family protein [Pirellulaceae bacterium]